MKHALAVTRDPASAAGLQDALSDQYTMDLCPDPLKMVPLIEKGRYDFLFIDSDLFAQLTSSTPASTPRDGVRLLRTVSAALEIVLLCTHQTLRSAVDAVRSGASNYLLCPIDKKEVRYIVDSTVEATRAQLELDYFRDQFWDSDALRLVSTCNREMRLLFDRIKSIAPTDTTVLIGGETGTGKGVVAKLIHAHSPRREKQFISVHCGAIPENLIESELFGHERGAFTGAVSRKLGKFEIAKDGTLFLDEVGTMPLSAQIRLLQVLQDRIFQRVGGEDTIRSNVRIIAASNVNLAEMTLQGSFRKDLYYRLNVFPIDLPPLRERTEDVEMLARDFLNRLDRLYAKGISGVDPRVLTALRAYRWPGNIRELENLIERAYLLESTATLTPESFPGELYQQIASITEVPVDTGTTLAEARRKMIDDMERAYLKQQLARHHGRIDATAHAAAITPRQLHKLLTRHGIRKEEFKSGTPGSTRTEHRVPNPC